MYGSPTRRTTLKIAGLLAAGGVASTRVGATTADGTLAESDWPHVRFDAANTSYNPATEGPQGEIEVDSIIDVPGDLSEALVVADGRIYLGYDEVIAAYDLDTGDELWTWNAPDIPRGGEPVAHTGQLLATNVGGLESMVGFLTPDTGDRHWRVRGTGRMIVTPTDNDVYVSEQNELFALAQFGEGQWREQFDGTIIGTAVDEEQLYLAFGDEIVAVDREAGEVQWRESVQALGEPVVGSEQIYIVGDTLIAFDKMDGAEQWRADELPAPVTTLPAVTDTTVYLGAGEDVEDTFYALDIETGDILWEAGLGGTALPGTSPATARPAVTAETVYVSGERTLHAIDSESGDMQWRESVGAEIGPPVPAGGMVLLPTEDNEVLAVTEAEGSDDPDGNGEESQDQSADDSTENEPAETESETDDAEEEANSDDGFGPGFGIPAALGALGGASYLLGRRFEDEDEDQSGEFRNDVEGGNHHDQAQK